MSNLCFDQYARVGKMRILIRINIRILHVVTSADLQIRTSALYPRPAPRTLPPPSFPLHTHNYYRVDSRVQSTVELLITLLAGNNLLTSDVNKTTVIYKYEKN